MTTTRSSGSQKHCNDKITEVVVSALLLLLRSFTSQSRRFLLFRVFARVQNDIYILNKVCRKYAEGMQCKSLTLSAYLVLQQVSLSQTAGPYFTKCIKTLNVFVETFFSPDIFGLPSFFFLSCVFFFWIRIFYRITNLTIQTRTTVLQNKYSYLNARKRSINTSSTPLIILINGSRLRLHS
jgi:hypothetical protein